MPKQIDSQKQKPILYETKNEKSPLNTAKNLVKPK